MILRCFLLGLFLTPFALKASSPLLVSKSISPSVVQPGDTVTVCITVQALAGTNSAQADIYWVFDTTGSMGSSIANLKTNIGAFTSQLASMGIDYRNGLIDYKDLTDPVPFADYGFASNDAQFSTWINGLSPSGGGDLPESGLEALTITANNAPWRPGASRTIILITDAAIHEAAGSTTPGTLYLTATAQSLKSNNIVVNVMSPATLGSYGTSNPQRLTDTAGGAWYDLYSASWGGVLANLGSSVASYSNVVIQDPFPAQLVPIAGQLDGATNTAGTLQWTVSSLAVGTSVTKCFLSLVAPGYSGPINNTACTTADNVSSTCGSAVPVYYVTPTFTMTPTLTISQTLTFSETPTTSETPSITLTFSETPTLTQTPTLTPTVPPLYLKLLPPSPNPGSTEAWLPFFLNTDADVDIKIYTVAGEPVRILDPLWTLRGYRERKWDLKNASGQPVASGIYIYRVRAISPIAEVWSDFSKCAVVR